MILFYFLLMQTGDKRLSCDLFIYKNLQMKVYILLAPILHQMMPIGIQTRMSKYQLLFNQMMLMTCIFLYVMQMSKQWEVQQINPQAGDILVAAPREMWSLFPPRTGSCPSTPARCLLSPRCRQSHTAEAQLPGTLEEKQSVSVMVTDSLPAFS